LNELRYLIVEEGTPSGGISSEYGTFPSLIIIDLNFNVFTGTIPYYLRSEILILQFVQLEGNTLPEEMRNNSYLSACFIASLSLDIFSCFVIFGHF